MAEAVLGINAYHGDASAVLLLDGECVAAAEEERFTRVKHQAGFPELATRWCLEEAGLQPQDIDHVAIGRNPISNLSRKLRYSLLHPPGMSFLRSRLRNAAHVLDVPSALANALRVPRTELRARFHRVEHHRSHLASAFFCSPFDSAACITLDGMGDFVSTTWGSAEGSQINILGEVMHPHSLGHFYQAFTQFLGMPKYGDEYKLMGLSAYGEPRFIEQVGELVSLGKGLHFQLDLDYFLHHIRGIDMTWEEGTPTLSQMWSDQMAEVFGAPGNVREQVTERDRDLAASVQLVLENVALEMLRRLYSKTGMRQVIMAGGVALNCVLTGKIREETPFEEVWVQPAANDSGISLGAALWVSHQVLRRPRSWVMTHAYLGPDFDDLTYKKVLAGAGLDYRSLSEDELIDIVSSMIAKGAVVGWFQGKMEFGPRALGNRSILCDPRRLEMMDVLNARIKHREPFRPFAPSILAERVQDWFVQDYPSSFMVLAYEVKPEKRLDIPAVTHVDGTSRLQTVDKDSNPRYWALLKAFEDKTGVPVLLNTSFNENEPICCRPEEAVDYFERTHMEALVLGNNLVDRTAFQATGSLSGD